MRNSGLCGRDGWVYDAPLAAANRVSTHMAEQSAGKLSVYIALACLVSFVSVWWLKETYRNAM